MNQLNNFFARLFQGRNGPDPLSFALTVLAVIINLLPIPYGYILALAIVAWAIFRMFSKNIARRQKENLSFMNLFNRVKLWYYKVKAGGQQRKFYKVFICPKCRQKLRVPRGKGKVSIKCSKCGNKFVKTT